MSEYQLYEFEAVDRPLNAKQMAELRAISTRATISPTRFRNEYHWGDLKADPAKLLERYFDAHLYLANWGTHRLILRMPKARVDVKRLKLYFVKSQNARLKSVGQHVIVDLTSTPEEPDDELDDEGRLGRFLPLRAELMSGDLRFAYLAWLFAVDVGDVDDEAVEPPVPAGLENLTVPQRTMVDFLRIDLDLVAAAASGSPVASDDGDCFRRWVARLPAKQQAVWLRRAATEPELALGNEMLRAFRATQKSKQGSAARTVGQLRALAERQRTRREGAEAERAKEAAQTAARARQRRLTMIGRDVDGAWAKLERLVTSSAYDDALKLAVDLRDLAAREDGGAAFRLRFRAMRSRQIRRRGFFDRWKWLEGNEER